jgi:hypothetical protein
MRIDLRKYLRKLYLFRSNNYHDLHLSTRKEYFYIKNYFTICYFENIAASITYFTYCTVLLNTRNTVRKFSGKKYVIMITW